jgi:hypothetical protein
MSNGFIYIRNAEDDAYVNHGNNFRGMEQIASAAVVLYFKAAASGTGQGVASYDKITLAVTANSEKQAMIDINGALFGGKAGSTTVIADDYVNASCSDLISTTAGVTSITKGVSGSFAAVEGVTVDDTLTASDSGKVFMFNDAAAVLTLPDSGDGDIIGWTATFHSVIQATGQEVKCTDTTNERMIGNLLSTHSDDDSAAAVPWNALVADNFSSIEFTSVADGALGSWFTLTCVAANLWHITGSLTQSGGSEVTPFATS